ncbi:hypothetical protein ACHAQA_007636 [Verticillium albo-atrum]
MSAPEDHQDQAAEPVLGITPNLTRKQYSPMIALCGLPGSGKSYNLKHFRAKLSLKLFFTYEDKDMVRRLHGTEKVDAATMEKYHLEVSRNIRRRSLPGNKISFVAKDYLVRPNGQHIHNTQIVKEDLEYYSHVLYLNTSPDDIAKNRRHKRSYPKPAPTTSQLQKWQEEEKKTLAKWCVETKTIFVLVPGESTLEWLIDFANSVRNGMEDANHELADRQVDSMVAEFPRDLRVDTIFAFNGDGTLSSTHGNTCFWEEFESRPPWARESHAVRRILSAERPLKEIDTAVRQSAMVYDQETPQPVFQEICERVAASVQLRPEFQILIDFARNCSSRARVVIFTSGPRQIWQRVLELNGLSKTFTVIGGGRFTDPEALFMGPKTRGFVVRRLVQVHRLRVWAFGGSPLDMPMLIFANQSIVVVEKHNIRSVAMDEELSLMSPFRFRARQALPLDCQEPQQNKVTLEIINILSQEFYNEIAGTLGFYSVHCDKLEVWDAEDENEGKLLLASMEDASFAVPPEQQDVRQRIGWNLAKSYVTKALGLEDTGVQHPDYPDFPVTLYKVCFEEQTVIVALGSEDLPLALGVSPCDIMAWKTVIVVEMILRDGEAIKEFIRLIRQVSADIRIVVLAAVVHPGLLSVRKPFHPILYVKLVRQYQTPAEREAEGKRKGYSRVLEGDLLRGEARMAEISQTGGQSSGSPEPSSSGDMASLEADRAPPADQEEARERWHEFLTHRFVHGEDDDFDYDKVDYDEAHDVMERRDAEEAWFEDEEPDWVSDQEVGSPAQRQPAHGGETGVQDF